MPSGNTQSQKISIIVVNCNGLPWLPLTLDSCFSQVDVNFEVVVVDDGSTDQSRKIIEDYATRHANLRPIFSEKNQGTSAARNLGIESAAGDFIAFLDSDDIFLPNTLATYHKKFLELSALYPDICMLSCDAWLINEKGQRKGRYMTPEWWERTELENPPLLTIPSTWFFPSSVPVRFFPCYRFADPPIFIHRMHKYGRVAFWGKPLTEYRLRMCSMTNAMGDLVLRDMVAFWKSRKYNRLEDPFKPWEIPKPSWRQIKGWTHGRTAKAAMVNGKYLLALKELIFAAIASPYTTFSKLKMILARIIASRQKRPRQ